MKLVTYRSGVEAAARLGLCQADQVIDVAALAASQGVNLPDTMLGLIDAGQAGLDALRALMASVGEAFPSGTVTALANVTLLAPIPRPRKNVFGIGLNYTEHVAESAKTLDTNPDLPREPVVFSKPPTSVIGPGEPILHDSSMTKELDWEVELAAIIGTRATRVCREDALTYIFGYSVMIDVSARDNRRAGQWIFSKGMDSYAPFGPCIITADEIPDPHTLDLWLTVNGVEKQRSNTAKMLFKVDELIADISRGITLEPGDIIATGTPEGVGAGRDPQEWMRPGDVIVACVEGVGTLRHPVVDNTPMDA
ncbi:fumarylacetoacetate hydrolase family protein [Sulfitobacter sp. KE34]|uniref:fumarylacetoacetate hydrolase family protein n=1 Tax=unclassified Sulfitobacter TaxID=196795 RepID=UPI0023E1D189|nr:MULTISPECIES: fumarylacetoacetate hydrolase family protein [unclassified Sulfitobacter]MDF3352025.1 fumarylacetoacetate hydrolase family protein [Sulfitobacter sp. KE12]MDF3355714.1 fumarylacetoacetate hydrolase family protein [Sulfitobacter sp. KE27]MDF3359271.1 fumarylacetoacetate hydrolase family protein [Sulfitobacter sp. KE33]MDF3366665.1 fumarylacetoacetate hydrolase family protein [Sulfitobacter sp. Ks34]MDF3370395.1 fumarylacetoacetate hydrolase family protein [Sulfitobacter sp. Ks4